MPSEIPTHQSQWHGILRLPEVQRLTGLSRSSIYRLESMGQFPARVKLSESASGWKAGQVQEWINSRPTVDQKGWQHERIQRI
jgi:prophage regulatory protein